MSIKTPTNIKLLTNVATVKLTRQSAKFEIACYRNKVTDWRNKQESNIEEVLQIDNIFTNVQQGKVASKKDLQKAFGKDMTKEEMVIEILNKGEMQISDLERESQNEKLKLEIANWIVRLSINSDNGNAFPVSIITKALTQANCRIKDTKTAKPQAVKFIEELKKVLPIKRRTMKLVITVTEAEMIEQLEELIKEDEEMVKDLHIESKQGMKLTVQIEPNLFRAVNALVKENKDNLFKGCMIEVVDNPDEPEQMRETQEEQKKEEPEEVYRKKGSKKESKIQAVAIETRGDDSDDFDDKHFGHKNVKAKKSAKPKAAEDSSEEEEVQEKKSTKLSKKDKKRLQEEQRKKEDVSSADEEVEEKQVTEKPKLSKKEQKKQKEEAAAEEAVKKASQTDKNDDDWENEGKKKNKKKK